MTMKFRKIKNITLPLLKMDAETLYYVKIIKAMYLGKAIDDKKEAATLADVINLETGETVQIICPTVLRQTLNEHYPNDSYVGKCFELVKHLVKAADTGALKYNTFNVAEIAEPEDDAPTALQDESEKSKSKKHA